MALATKYSPAEVEDKWYQYWMDKGFFHSEPNPNKEPYSIVIPPPNVTGVLHMGHMLNNTIQDVLIRKARMEGKEACWVPGTDHASIATEARVVAMLKEKGIKKSDIGREEFLKYAWEWKEKYGGIILEQLKKLGASCDWERTKFTMDPPMTDAVIDVFIDLYKKGYIYRGLRMVNWDPAGKTAVSDDEVNYKDVNSKLYYINYAIEGSSEFVTIATTRPETIMADSAVCINPNDERYKHLKGKKVLIPLINRAIPIIEDEYVAMDFGTGCLKVTPAHDLNDYELGLKHKLEVIDILNDDGTLNALAKIYVGEDRFVARKKIGKELEEKGLLSKVEDYKSNVGHSERTDAVIEPRLSLQWFVKMKDITQPALENVMNDTIQLIPPKFKNTYKHWMENVRDWCISRQLWWGQRIPAWYAPDGTFVVAKSSEEAYSLFKIQNSTFKIEELRQDEDVLDTWFSSWLWPISVFDPTIFGDPKNKGNADLNYYYPTNDLITAPEILFFWVARMVMAGYEYRGEMPFKNVYLTGIVRDKLGRKMSKSLGNSPDPLDLIKTYGADGVRTGMLFSSPAGNDLLFDEKLCEQGRNFSNKIWNAFRLIKGWEVAEEPRVFYNAGEAPDVSFWKHENEIAIDWFTSRLNQSIIDINDHFDKFRISDALHTIYKLVWDDFCAWYLEMIKPEYGQPIDSNTYEATMGFFETLLKLLHPFMPFITEELWHELRNRETKDCIIVSLWPKSENQDGDANLDYIEKIAFEFEPAHIEKIKNGIIFIRKIRQKDGLKNNELVDVYVTGSKPELITLNKWRQIIENLSSSKVKVLADPVAQGGTFYSDFDGSMHWNVKKKNDDKAGLINQITKDIEYQKGFIVVLDKKLLNEKFIASAKPEVVALERKKKSDAEAKIKSLEESLKNLY